MSVLIFNIKHVISDFIVEVVDDIHRHVDYVVSCAISLPAFLLIHHSILNFTHCSQKEFKGLISDWMLDESKGETEESHPWKITESEIQTQKEKVLV